VRRRLWLASHSATPFELRGHPYSLVYQAVGESQQWLQRETEGTVKTTRIG